jgi:hypothetical protein
LFGTWLGGPVGGVGRWEQPGRGAHLGKGDKTRPGGCGVSFGGGGLGSKEGGDERFHVRPASVQNRRAPSPDPLPRHGRCAPSSSRLCTTPITTLTTPQTAPLFNCAPVLTHPPTPTPEPHPPNPNPTPQPQPQPPTPNPPNAGAAPLPAAAREERRGARAAPQEGDNPQNRDERHAAQVVGAGGWLFWWGAGMAFLAGGGP